MVDPPRSPPLPPPPPWRPSPPLPRRKLTWTDEDYVAPNWLLFLIGLATAIILGLLLDLVLW